MNTEEMLREVDRRVADGFVEHLLPKAVKKHTFKSKEQHWKECPCNYCKEKRTATLALANMVYPKDFAARKHVSIWEYDYEYWEIKKARRDSLREHYRAKLRVLINE